MKQFEHKCDECGGKVKRNVFCNRACNTKYFNKKRYHSNEGVLSVEEKKPEPEEVLHNPYQICPKHNVFYSTCGCK